MTIAQSSPTNLKSVRKVHIAPSSSPSPKPHHQPQARFVETSMPGVKVIARQDLWNDFRNRLRINNYEVRLLTIDLKNLFIWINKNTLRLINAVDNAIGIIRKTLNMR